jgi:hypothetical protein
MFENREKETPMAALCKRWAVAAVGLIFIYIGHCQATGLPSPEDITWTWMKGINTSEQVGAYGTQGVASAENRPGGRYGSVSWRDPSGQMWLFGGLTSWDIVDDLWLLAMTPDIIKN